MDPRNRLWSELIFPYCNLNVLLALRAVCRGLREQLNAWRARLWSQALQNVRRMSYAERQLGWRGVECARERERVTRANCDAGIFTAGAVLTLPSRMALRCVAGRIVDIDVETVQLFDADSGALVVTHAVAHSRFVRVVQDRWVVLVGIHTVCMIVVDCADARVTTYAPGARGLFDVFSVCGARVLYTMSGAPGATVVHISADAAGATVVRVVAHVECAPGEKIVLCQRGHSILRVNTAHKLHLCSVATGSTIRSFDLPAEYRFSRLFLFDSCDFVGASAESNVTGLWRSAMVVFRLSDGASSAPFTSRPAQPLIVDGGRLHTPDNSMGKYALVDAATLAVSDVADMARRWTDQSGALLWRRDGAFVAASAIDSRGTAVLSVDPGFAVLDFSYGVAVVRDYTTCRVCRFDRGSDAADPPVKVSHCVSIVARH